MKFKLDRIISIATLVASLVAMSSSLHAICARVPAKSP